jgi:hypothetical protein
LLKLMILNHLSRGLITFNEGYESSSSSIISWHSKGWWYLIVLFVEVFEWVVEMFLIFPCGCDVHNLIWLV